MEMNSFVCVIAVTCDLIFRFRSSAENDLLCLLFTCVFRWNVKTNIGIQILLAFHIFFSIEVYHCIDQKK